MINDAGEGLMSLIPSPLISDDLVMRFNQLYHNGLNYQLNHLGNEPQTSRSFSIIADPTINQIYLLLTHKKDQVK